MDYHISSRKSDIKLQSVKKLLAQTYWAKERTEAQIAQSIEHSLCFGVYLDDGTQIGFARAITDYVTSYYICDVIVDEAFRGNGIGTALIQKIVEDPRLDGLRGILATSHAQALYNRFGFQTDGERLMERKPRQKTL